MEYILNFALVSNLQICPKGADVRHTAGQFSAGNTGRPKGSRNKATIAIEGLLQGQAETFTQTAVKKALKGDSVALRLCLERIAPALKDKPVSFSLLR